MHPTQEERLIKISASWEEKWNVISSPRLFTHSQESDSLLLWKLLKWTERTRLFVAGFGTGLTTQSSSWFVAGNSWDFLALSLALLHHQQKLWVITFTPVAYSELFVTHYFFQCIINITNMMFQDAEEQKNSTAKDIKSTENSVFNVKILLFNL